jgi:hypothetical protein
VGWEVLEPSSAALQATATPSQLPAQNQKRGQVRDRSSFRPDTKKARCLLTPGLQKEALQEQSSAASEATWMHGQTIKHAAQNLSAGAFAHAMIFQIAETVKPRHKLFP